MLNVSYSNKFKKDFKLIKKRGYKIDKLINILNLLINEETLPEKYFNHALTGNFIGFSECHIEPDWLLIYRIENGLLELTRTGTHSDLFK